MTDAQIKTARDLQLAFREQLRQLCIAQYETAQEAELPATVAAGIVAEECMHMSAWFVARGSNFSMDTFLDECRKVFEFHKEAARKEQGRPN